MAGMSTSIKVLLLFCMLLPAISAAQLQATYIISDVAFVQYSMVLDHETISIPLPADAQNLYIDENPVLPKEQVIVNGTGRVDISFYTTTVLEHTSSEHIVGDLSAIPASLHSVRVILPEAAHLTRSLRNNNPSITPLPSSTATDGERLVFIWKGEDLEPARAFIVTYDMPSKDFIPIFLSIIAALGVSSLISVFVLRRKKRSTLLQNLYEDERLLVSLLLAAPKEGIWQKELTQRANMSKVKVSRKLRSLEAKGVIERIPYGNTNRIRVAK